jgi:hypothetical protein
MDPKHKGAVGELMASTWLLRQGYEVFRNVSPHGIADMVAWKPGEPPIMVEVRKLSLHVAKDGKSCSVGGRRTYGPGVFVLHVDTETGKCGFDLEALVAGLGYRLRPSRTYTHSPRDRRALRATVISRSAPSMMAATTAFAPGR